MAAPAAAPPAAPAGVTIIDTGPPKPPPPPTSTIRVSEMPKSTDIPSPNGPKSPGMERIRQKLQEKAKPQFGEEAIAPAGPKPKPEEKPKPKTPPQRPQGEDETSPAETETNPLETETEQPPDETAAAVPETAETDKPKGKVSPFKIIDDYKKRNTALEKELSELKTQLTPEADRRKLTERAETAEKFAQQMADEIRFHAYEKSPEFQKQYQTPYEEAFRSAMEDLSEVTVTSPEGQTRKMEADDLAQLAFMPFAQAKELTERLYPDFAEDLMAARKDIKKAWEKRKAALSEWKEKGLEHQKQLMEQQQKLQTELATTVNTTWTKANEDAIADPKTGGYFKPREGDQEWNQRLAKGFELVDRAFSENPLNPSLTPEQRAQAVRRHAAVRARAAGWGPLRRENEKLQARLAEVEKELASYKEIEPPAAGREAEPVAGGSGKGMDRIRSELQKYASRSA